MKSTYKLIFLINVLISTYFINQAHSSTPLIEVKKLNNVFPGLYNKLESTYGRTNFDLSNINAQKNRAVLFSNDQIQFITVTGDEIRTFDLARYNLTKPSSGHFAWSPNGEKVLCKIRSQFSSYKNLYLLDIHGNLEQIVQLTGRGDQVLQPDWSHDGRLISYVKTIRSGPSSSVYIKNIETGIEQLIGNPLSGKARWAHSSNKLLFENAIPPYNLPQRPKIELFCYNFSDNKKFKFYNELFTGIEIFFSSNDSLILLHADNGLLLLDQFGNEIKKFKVYGSDHQWSPNNKRICFIDFDVNEEGLILNQYIKVLNIKNGSVQSFQIDMSIHFNSIIWLNASTILYN